MAAHKIVSVETRPASGPGALEHGAAVCSCGFVARNSLGERAARQDAAAHIAYFARREVK